MVVKARGLYVLSIAWTLFSVYIYRSFSSLGDSAAYIEDAYADHAQLRTRFISYAAMLLRTVTGHELGSHLGFSLFCYSGLAYLVVGRCGGAAKLACAGVMLSPNFGVWSSVVGREALFIGFLGYSLGALLRHYNTGKLRYLCIAFATFLPLVFLRSAYGASLGVFYLGYLVFRRPTRCGLTVSLLAALSMVVLLLGLIFFSEVMDKLVTHKILPEAKSYFTTNSPTTRAWVRLDTSKDYLASLPWSIPLSLLGPTWGEVLRRPVMLPFFLGGLVSLMCLFVACCSAVFGEASFRERRILLFGWLPAVVTTLLVYMPYGIYNPGSGIRYASCFIVFLWVPLIMRAYRPARRQ